jgi:hypothetical protein
MDGWMDGWIRKDFGKKLPWPENLPSKLSGRTVE